MRIAIVEDDVETSQWLTHLLSEEFPGVEILAINNESSFRRTLPELAAKPPNVVVLDMLLRWSDSPAEPSAMTDFVLAGLRCQKLLASDPRTKWIPVIFYTAVEQHEIPWFRLPKNVFYSLKGGDPLDFLRKVRSVLTAQQMLPTNSGDVRDRVFISYSHNDEKFLEELFVHLKPLQRAGRVSAWSDQQIEPGAQWFKEIMHALALTKVAVMLVSKDFLASDFIHEYELGPLLKEAEVGGAQILWFLVRACSYRESVLKNYQSVIPPNRPLAVMKAERDTAWVRICDEIKKAANRPLPVPRHL